MNAILKYSDESDSEIYLEEKVGLRVVAATMAGSQEKPNEDAFAVAVDGEYLIAGVFDGTTSLKPIKSLGDQSGARFAAHFLKSEFANLDPKSAARQMLLELNRKILEKSLQFEGASLSDTHTLPASGGTMVKIEMDKNLISFAHLHDSCGVKYYKDGRSEVFTDDKNHKFDARMFDLIAQIAKEKDVTPKVARQDERVKQALIQMFIERNNNPDGTGNGLINGDPNMEQYIYSGSFGSEDLKAVLLCTDGLVPQGWSINEHEDRMKILNLVEKDGFQGLFTVKRQSEDNDPDWNHIRYKHSDDATGLLIMF
jgi:serine/threonine protein phosphatase PrpC